MDFTFLRKHKALTIVVSIFSISLIIGGGVLYSHSKEHTSNQLTKPNSSSLTSTLGSTTTKSPVTTPASQTNSQQSNSTRKPYSAPVCTDTPIPYKTIYLSDPNRNVGDTYTSPGRDGYVKHCTPDSNGIWLPDWTVQPFNATIYVGAKPVSQPATPLYTQAQALSIAQNNCAPYSNTSAYQPCVSAYLHQFGY